MKSRYKKLVVLSVILCVGFLFAACENQSEQVGGKGSSWVSSSPEAQGMDSKVLLEMLETNTDRGFDIHSLLIIRNGHMVLESSNYPYESDAPHMIHSITKNVTATLVGIAIDEGYIESVDQQIVELLPDLSLKYKDDRIQDITVKHLLTMKSGLNWRPAGASMYTEGEDHIIHALEREMATNPGEMFEYHSGSTHLLSMILTEATGRSTMEYAKEKLFTPLDIEDIHWAVDYQDFHVGGDMLFMRPTDLAKFGLLYLQQGLWEGERIVPEEWVAISTKNHVDKESYGYSWWIGDNGGFSGNGVAGQRLTVLPEEELIFVVTSGIGRNAVRILDSITRNRIMDAVIAEESIEENPEAFDELQSLVAKLKKPNGKATDPTLPKTATKVGGNTYLMENGEAFTVDFSEENETTWIWHREGAGETEITIGLDNVFRKNRIENFHLYNQIPTKAMLRGQWEDDNTFILDFTCLENPMAYYYEFTFDGDTLHHTRTERLNNSVYLTTTGTVEK